MPTVEPEDFRYFITVQNILHGCTLLIPKLAFERHGWFNEHLITTPGLRSLVSLRGNRALCALAGRRCAVSLSCRTRHSRRMNDIMMAEADRLLTDFVENLTPEQIRRAAPGIR
jgi:hypothetical protein